MFEFEDKNKSVADKNKNKTFGVLSEAELKQKELEDVKKRNEIEQKNIAFIRKRNEIKKKAEEKSTNVFWGIVNSVLGIGGAIMHGIPLAYRVPCKLGLLVFGVGALIYTLYQFFKG